MLADFQHILSLFSLIKEKFIHKIEHFDWWKHQSGYSLRICNELLFNTKLLFASCSQICLLRNSLLIHTYTL